MLSIGELRIILVDQADEEIRKIDIFTETRLATSEYLKDGVASARLNALREELVAEVREALRFNLENLKVELETLSSTETFDFHTLFRQFCFTQSFGERLCLVCIDRFLPQDQIEMIQKLVTTSRDAILPFTYLNTRESYLQFLDEKTLDHEVR
jgi:hypothetical protein